MGLGYHRLGNGAARPNNQGASEIFRNLPVFAAFSLASSRARWKSGRLTQTRSVRGVTQTSRATELAAPPAISRLRAQNCFGLRSGDMQSTLMAGLPSIGVFEPELPPTGVEHALPKHWTVRCDNREDYLIELLYEAGSQRSKGRRSRRCRPLNTDQINPASGRARQMLDAWPSRRILR